MSISCDERTDLQFATVASLAELWPGRITGGFDLYFHCVLVDNRYSFEVEGAPHGSAILD